MFGIWKNDVDLQEIFRGPLKRAVDKLPTTNVKKPIQASKNVDFRLVKFWRKNV